jgi:hypothetical protein
MENTAYIYISEILRKDNWVTGTARCLAKNTKVIRFTCVGEPYPSIQFRQLFTTGTVLRILSMIRSVCVKNFTDWIFVQIIPMNKFNIVRDVNIYINAFVLKILLRKYKIVIIYGVPFQTIQKFIWAIHPHLVIGDCHDIWTKEQLIDNGLLAQCTLTHSTMLYRKIHTYAKNVQLISAGYYSKQMIHTLHIHNHYNSLSQKVLYDGNFSWRANIPLIEHLVSNLPQYRFFCIGKDEFYDQSENELIKRNMYWKEWYESNQKIFPRWESLRNSPRITVIPIEDQKKLYSVKFTASVGIIPYDVLNPTFNFVDKYCFPIKLFHYFAMGIPVVSTPIPSILKYESEYVKFARSKEEFVECIQTLSRITIPDTIKQKMYGYALEQTFEEKVAKIHAIVRRYGNE